MKALVVLMVTMSAGVLAADADSPDQPSVNPDVPSQERTVAQNKYSIERTGVFSSWETHVVLDSFFLSPKAWFAKSTQNPARDISLRYWCDVGGITMFLVVDKRGEIVRVQNETFDEYVWEAQDVNSPADVVELRPDQPTVLHSDAQTLKELMAAGTGNLRLRVSSDTEIVATMTLPLRGFGDASVRIDQLCPTEPSSESEGGVETTGESAEVQP